MKCATGKNRYGSKSLAETALIDVQIHCIFPPDHGPQNVYQCEISGEWHLTSKSLKRNAKLQKMIDSGEMRRMQQARRWE